jgi:Holliday junction DNA helicase RuvB
MESKEIWLTEEIDIDSKDGLPALNNSTSSLTPSLRPSSLDDYIGQVQAKTTLAIACDAALKRGEALDHVLLHGPAGLGKTSMAQILSRRLGVKFRGTSGPLLERPGDLATILTSLEAHEVLFVDEIHRLPRVVEEVLYQAMEDYQLDILIGQGAGAKSLKIDLQRFTLVGATTRSGELTAPLRDRFGLTFRLNYYSLEELSAIITRSAKLLNVELDSKSAEAIALRSRGTPRVANRLLKRVRDYALYRNESKVFFELTEEALDMLGIDKLGLDDMDREILQLVADTFNGGPVGIESIAAALSENRGTLEDVYEPFLIQSGLLARTRRGRIITELGLKTISKGAESPP